MSVANSRGSATWPLYTHLVVQDPLTDSATVTTQAVLLYSDEQRVLAAVPAHAGIRGNGPFQVEAINAQGEPLAWWTGPC